MQPPAGAATAPPAQILPPRRALPRPVARARHRRAGMAMRAGGLPWVPVWLALGIALWFIWPGLPQGGAWALPGMALAAGLVAWRVVGWAEAGRVSWQGAAALRIGAFALALVAAGYGVAMLRNHLVAAPVLGFRYYGPVEGRVVDIDRSARDRMRITLDQVVLRRMTPERTPKTVRLSLMGDATDTLPPLGQRVMLTGHLGPPPGPAAPGSFDFRQHAWFMGLGAVGYVRSPIMSVAPPQGGFSAVHSTRMTMAEAIRTRIGGQEGAVAAALVTGDRSGITEATNEIMRGSNLYHIISISGLHMSMLSGFVYASLRLILAGAVAVGLRPRWPGHKLAAVGAIAVAAGYLWLSGGGVATERAFIMVAIMLGAILADRRAISLRTVALAATVIMVLAPEAVLSPGFQLSFAATVALILTIGPWSRIAPRLPWWLRPVAMLLVSSFVAGMATAPIAAAHFNRMAQYGLLANLLAVPVMGTLVMPAGVIAALLAPLGLAGPALWVMGLGTRWMLMVAEWITGLAGSVSAVMAPPWPVLPLLLWGACIAALSWRGGAMRRAGAPLMGVALGGAMAAASMALWLAHSRPALLIAGEGEAVGLMTPAGRALSRPTGGSFVTSTWLLEDGDTATPAQSAARPAWQGDRRDRVASLPGGWQVLHFTGKGAGERAAPACHVGRIVVATEALSPRPRNPACILLDLPALREYGATAIGFDANGQLLLHSTNAMARGHDWVAR